MTCRRKRCDSPFGFVVQRAGLAPCALAAGGGRRWFFARAFAVGRFSCHVAIATAVAGYAKLEWLKFLVDAISGRQMLRLGAGLDLPPFTANAQAPGLMVAVVHGIARCLIARRFA
jgi:hypothetical protein